MVPEHPSGLMDRFLLFFNFQQMLDGIGYGSQTLGETDINRELNNRYILIDYQINHPIRNQTE